MPALWRDTTEVSCIGTVKPKMLKLLIQPIMHGCEHALALYFLWNKLDLVAIRHRLGIVDIHISTPMMARSTG